MKFIKRVIKLVVIACLILVLAGVAVFLRVRQEPEWYAKLEAFDPAQLEQAARDATQKLLSTAAWLKARQAAEFRANAGDARAPLSPVPSDVYTVTLTERELNAIFQRWTKEMGWEQAYGPYVSNPVIAIRDGKIILAGNVKEIGRVVSFHFRPKFDKQAGRLGVELESVMAGRLPMPQAIFEQYRQRLGQKVYENLPDAQQDAKLREDGSVNENAVAATIGEFMLAVIQRKTVEPVLLLQGNNDARPDQARLVPVRMVDLSLANEGMTFSVEMMNPQEREAWLQRLRGAWGVTRGTPGQ